MRPAIGIRQRLLGWGALILVMTVGSGYFSALTFARVSRTTTEAVDSDRENVVLVHELAASLEDEDDALLFSLSGDTSHAQEDLATQRHRFDEALAQLRATTRDPADLALIDTLDHEDQIYRAKGDELILTTGPAARDMYLSVVTPLLRQATNTCAELREHRARMTRAVAAGASADARSATYLVASGSVAALLLLVIIAWRLARTVVRPLSELTQSVEMIREGDFARRVAEPQSDDELGKLGHGFNRMAEALEEFHASQLGEVLAAKRTLETTLEALPEAVLVVSDDDTVTLSNAQARALFAKPLTSIDDVPLPAASLAAIREARRGESPMNPSRTDLGRAMSLTVKEERRLFLPRVVPSTKCVVIVLDDVTELARLDEMRTEFIATASHELRTPLTTLQMTLALLAEAESALTDGQKETLATARLGCQQLTTTVDAFLDVTRIQAGRLIIARDPIDVPALIALVARSLRSRFEERDVVLDVPSTKPAFVRGDKERLAAAISNLLTNALKYSPRTSLVRVTIMSPPSDVDSTPIKILIDDEGPGVPTDLRERVFEKYFRVEHVQEVAQDEHEHPQHTRGAGIGLYLCRQIAEAHGGAVHCDTSPAGGARFVLELPPGPAVAIGAVGAISADSFNAAKSLLEPGSEEDSRRAASRRPEEDSHHRRRADRHRSGV